VPAASFGWALTWTGRVAGSAERTEVVEAAGPI